MLLNGKEVAFPAICKTSFFKLFELLEIQATDPDKNVATFAQKLLKEVEKYPLLREGFEDAALNKTYEAPIAKLCRTLFPDALLTNEIKAVVPPFIFSPIYTSTRFNKIFSGFAPELIYNLKDLDDDTYYLYGCYSILGSYYGYPIHAGGPMTVEIENKEKGIKKVYRMAFNADMIEFVPTEKSIDISEEDFRELLDDFENIDLWKQKFPPDSWIMRGIGIINLTDVTIDDSHSSITSNLLIKSKDSFKNIHKGIKNLLNSSSLQVGMVTLYEHELVKMHKSNVQSILLGDEITPDCSEDICQSTFKQLTEHKQPLIIPDVEKYYSLSKSAISQRLMELKIKSYIIAPLILEDELLGFIELSSNKIYELNSVSLSRINEILPVLTLAIKRFKTEEQNQVEAIIQQECTPIHESVKWRFEAEAQKFLAKQLNKEQSVFEDLQFKDVYPLYGQLDIRNSSTKRNEAVKTDLLRQMKEVRKILQSAFDAYAISAYEELTYRVDRFISKIKKGLSAGSEHLVLQFLNIDIYPVFAHLKEVDNAFAQRIASYESLLDPELNTIYYQRKKYDQSVNKINSSLAYFLDDLQEQAQQIFPHYFERYKTDGVEYNMYIGQSISKNKKFDLVYLQNLRLWQLMAMCELELEYRRLQKQLDTDIEIASLILVYNTALAVHFRMDEKRFDVEGAYNARYEIIKKRVDKANIKGTTERITQPGCIAIIYSQEQDAIEYRNYIDFLQSKKYFTREIEELEIEDLQGITGLKALRIKIDFSRLETHKEGYSVEELIETISDGGRLT